jgi:nicotinate-nucleotide pyrophosphorylase (carboxylating)
MDTQKLIDQIIGLALEEDGTDITSNAIFGQSDSLRAVLTAKGAGTVAGLDIVRKVFEHIDPEIVCVFDIKDGDRVIPGQKIGVVRGPALGILKGERVALNFLQRMSGIATMSAEYVKRIAGTKARIIDTRKTSPGSRIIDKMAVASGGARNHRMGLWDMALIKDNHIDAAGSLAEAVRRVKTACPGVPVEVEARTLEDVKALLDLAVDRIMLDNFSTEDMKAAVALVAGRVELEASGGITLDTVRKAADTGVDFISVGELTHSVKALDISMTIEVAS